MNDKVVESIDISIVYNLTIQNQIQKYRQSLDNSQMSDVVSN